MGSILHIHNQSLPPSSTSGGSNRLIDWLAIEQSRQGHKVYALSPLGHSTEHYTHITLPEKISYTEIRQLIPDDVTDIEYHGGLDADVVEQLFNAYPRSLYLVHSGQGEGRNNVFVSHSHAQQAGKEVFAYNGIPCEEFIFEEQKGDFLLFLAKVKRRKKGVAVAIKLAKQSKTNLVIAGGRRLRCPETWFNWHPRITPVGYINGPEKYALLSQAKALIVPILWDEPFGLTIVEAMLSGTPVIAFNRGAMPELIIDGVTGFLCNNEAEMLAAINKVDTLSPLKCRKHAEQYFSSFAM